MNNNTSKSIIQQWTEKVIMQYKLNIKTIYKLHIYMSQYKLGVYTWKYIAVFSVLWWEWSYLWGP